MTTTLTITLPYTLKDLRQIYRSKFNIPDHEKVSKQMIADWLGDIAEREINKNAIKNESFDRMMQGIPGEHDMDACNALKEYNRLCHPFDWFMEQKQTGLIDGKNPFSLPSMNVIAEKYHTTIDRMKEHWPCVEYLEKKNNRQGARMI